MLAPDFRENPDSGGWSFGATKPVVVVLVRRVVVVAVGAACVGTIIVPGTAAQHTVGAVFRFFPYEKCVA